jgi:hypothetical protein
MTQPNNLTATEVNALHRQSDRDTSKEALHHTLGPRPYQSAPGDHSHDGRSSKILDPVSVAPHSHAASTVTTIPSGGLSSSDVAAALNELEGEIQTLTASDIDSTAVGGVSATNVQAAIQELDSEKANTAHTHSSLATPTNVTGSRGGNAALASLLTALAGKGIITDSTVA